MKPPRKRTTFPKTISLPQPLWDWLETDAENYGMTRNNFISFQLQMAKQNKDALRIRTLEQRILALEEWKSSCLKGL